MYMLYLLQYLWVRKSESNMSSLTQHESKWRNRINQRDTIIMSTAASSSLKSVEENIQGIEHSLHPFIQLVEEKRKMLLNVNILGNSDTWLATARQYTILRQVAGEDTYIPDIHKFKIPIIKLTVPKETLKKYMVQNYYNMSFNDHHGLDNYFSYIRDTGLNSNDSIKALNSPLPFNYNMNMKYSFKSLDNDSYSTMGFIHVLSDAIVLPEGEVLYADVKLHPGGCFYSGAPMLTNHSASKLLFADEVFTISQRNGHAVFHMMIEDVPRIVPYVPFLRHHKQIKIHVRAKTKLTIEMLSLLGIEKERLIDGYVRARIMYIPMGTCCGVANMFNIQLLSLYYRRTISQVNKDAHGSTVLIKRSRNRFFTHHNKILQQLQLMGMRYNRTIQVFADNPLPSFQRIMRMFNSASMIVGPHGAGLSNMIFAKPGTIIVEAICSKRESGFINHCFAILSFILGHIYYGIIPSFDCTTVTETDLMLPVQHYLTWLQNKNSIKE